MFSKILNFFIKFSLYSLIFLLPLFFLPFSFESYEFNKQYLLFFLVSLAFLSWLAKMIFCDKEIRFRRTPLDIPVLAFMLVSILSAVFSIDKTSSFFGFYGRFSDNLVGILSLGLLYFLITNNVKSLKDDDQKTEKTPKPATIDVILRAFFWSVFFVLLTVYFSIFGVWQILSKYVNFFQNFGRMFNTISVYLEPVALFFAVSLMLIVVTLFQNKNSKLKKFFLFLLLFLSVIFLIIVDFSVAWAVLGISLTLFLVFAFWSRIFREKVNWLLIPIFLVLISIFFTFFSVSKYRLFVSGANILDHQREILLDQKTSWQVSWGAIKHYPILGSGIGTFSMDFSQFRPKRLNETNFWQIRFSKAGNQISELISTRGILGFLSWLTIVGLFLIISYYFLKKLKKEKTPANNYQLYFIFTFISLILCQIFYYQNTTLDFIFWLVLGCGVISWQAPAREKIFSFNNFPEIGLIFNIFLIIIIGIVLLSWFFGIRFYLADVKYKEGILNNQLEYIEKAASLNKIFPTYKIALSQIYLVSASNELQKSAGEQDIQKIQNHFAKAIDESKIAVQRSQKWVATFENLGKTYRDISSFTTGADQFAIDNFQKALELEPFNPVFYTEIGKILLKNNKIDEAKEKIGKALDLKNDYLDAKIQLALISEKEGKPQEAISSLEKIVNEDIIKDPYNASNIEAIYQLGRLYYNNDRTDDAIQTLQLALKIFPNHSNSLYILALAYEKKGNKEEAIKTLEKVSELNPDIQEIKSKIEELKNPLLAPTPTPTPKSEPKK